MVQCGGVISVGFGNSIVPICYSSSHGKQKGKSVLSPHLMIYKMPVSAIFSIAHRASGVALYIAIVTLLWIISIDMISNHTSDPLPSASLSLIMSCMIGKISTFFLGSGLIFHGASGVRYLAMDTFGIGMRSEKAKNISLLCVAGASLVLIFALFMVIFA